MSVIYVFSIILLLVDNISACNIYTCSNVWDGQCGAFKRETSKWCDYDVDDHYDGRICCADDFNECCEDDPAAIGGTIAGAAVFLIFSFWYCRRRRDNTNDELPNFCFKFFCPPCAVLGYQGCESKMDGCMACCLCNFFTLCCWEPKEVVVDNPDNSSDKHDVEIINIDI